MTKSNMACPTVMRLNFPYDAKTGIIKRLHLGLFNSKQDAIIARLSAEAKFGYHENHGAR